MQTIEKVKIPCYSMKMQIYPSGVQKEKIEKIFNALRVAYNITFHEVFLKNPAVCTEPNKDGAVWPDCRKMAKKSWIDYLRTVNPAVSEAPAASLMTQNGLFLLDAKRAWEKGMGRRPVDASMRGQFHFYGRNKQRRSFFTQIPAKKVVPSQDNDKVAWITIPKVGTVKARGFNRKIWFGKDGIHTFQEALQAGEIAEKLSLRVSEDSCGDYFVSITISEGQKKEWEIFKEEPVRENLVPVGMDVGIKHIAILSDGQKVENKHFKRENDQRLRRMNRGLSRKWGPANIAFRDYNQAIRKENLQCSEQLPLASPSNSYLKAQQRKARQERRISRRRNTYYHQQTAAIVRQSSLIAIETLRVKNMLRNHKLAYALSDAAFGDFLSKITYKAERVHIPVLTIGMFEPSSQMCSFCHELYPPAKNLSVRSWICPSCGTKHDRDINAAKNILAIAQSKGTVEDKELPAESRSTKSSPERRKQRPYVIFEEQPDIVVAFSKELTRINNPRYIIFDRKNQQIIDDAQGAGYRSISNAKNCYKAKKKRMAIS